MTKQRSRRVLLGLLLATLMAYQPAWTGGMLWDDEGHVTRSDLQSLTGLTRIWIEPGATQQYYPLVHTSFWVFHRLWGDATVGYHLANIGLHALSSFLLWLILHRLLVPGATLAAFVFALHPVQVESVAWIAELKNIQSGVFYFAAALAYLRYETARSRKAYAWALVLFAMAVASKTVTATLPIALLVITWWRKGRVSLRDDVRPLVPFAVIGAAAGLTTIWVEHSFIGAQGTEFELSVVVRCLLASRAVWFYLWKLTWPSNLIFIYPRWHITPTSIESWLCLIALAALLEGCIVFSTRNRGPLTAILFFVVTLFPALGFFDVYPFRFSFVADHFQYLAAAGPIAWVAAVASTVTSGKLPRKLRLMLALIVVSGLGALTFAQSRPYRDAESLYRATLVRNPDAWIAHNNLAALLLAGDPVKDRLDEAVAHLEAALRLEPDYAEAHYNLGTALERLDRLEDAAEQYRQVLTLVPGERRASERLAVMRLDRATRLLKAGLQAENQGRIEDAVLAYREASEIDPQRAVLHRSLGRALHRLGRREEAMTAYLHALAIDDSSAETHNDLGVLLAESGRIEEAAEHFERAVRLNPTDAGARANLEKARLSLKR
jgi:tetratricopeptide (TPR) repeat protein